jgi:hypothetical protein
VQSGLQTATRRAQDEPRPIANKLPNGLAPTELGQSPGCCHHLPAGLPQLSRNEKAALGESGLFVRRLAIPLRSGESAPEVGNPEGSKFSQPPPNCEEAVCDVALSGSPPCDEAETGPGETALVRDHATLWTSFRSRPRIAGIALGRPCQSPS